MSRVNIKLSYSRTLDGNDTVRGHLCVVTPKGNTDEVEFDTQSFVWMFTRLAELVRKYDPSDVKEVEVLRVDVAGGHTAILSHQFLELLRTDITAALRELSPPSRRVIVRGGPRDGGREYGIVPRLRAGADTRAEAFGINLYSRARDGNVESPVTGRWETVYRPYQDIFGLAGDARVERSYGAASLGGIPVTGLGLDGQDYTKWALFRVSDLLNSDIDNFYFPRQWNGSAWASKENLRKRYEAYCEEIQCLETTTIEG